MGNQFGQIPPLCLDDEATWPFVVLKMLADGFAALEQYERRRISLDELDTFERLLLGQDANPFRVERDQIISDIQDAIFHRDLLGYHCTRIAHDEAALLLDDGLQPLTPELISNRIRARVSAGDLNDQQADRLIREGDATNDRRAGRIWFCFTRALLRDESGVGFPLGLWGGEATYGSHHYNLEIFSALRRIGFAAIVEAAVPIPRIETFMTVSERLVAAYLGRRGISTRTGPETDGYIDCPVRPSRLIMEFTPEFVALTGCDTWAGNIFRERGR